MQIIVDFFVIALLAWGFIRGFIKGLIIQVISILIFLAIVFFGSDVSVFLAKSIADNINVSEWFIPIISFFIVVILFFIVGWVIGKIFSKLLKAFSIAFYLNAIGGALFGVLKMALILGFLFRLLAFDRNNKFISYDLFHDSNTIKPILTITNLSEPIYNKAIDKFYNFSNLSNSESNENEKSN